MRVKAQEDEEDARPSGNNNPERERHLFYFYFKENAKATSLKSLFCLGFPRRHTEAMYRVVVVYIFPRVLCTVYVYLKTGEPS